MVSGGDLLIGMDGEFNIAKWRGGDSLLNQRVCRLTENAQEVLKGYLLYCLPGKLKAIEAATPFATVKHLSSKTINEIRIPLPPLPTQRAIAATLDQAAALIALRRRQAEKLDLLVRARFAEMFGDIGEEIEIRHYVNALIAGKSLAGEMECGNKVLKTSSVRFDAFDAAQTKDLPAAYEPLALHAVNRGDVLISRMNTLELVGAAAYVWKGLDHTYLPDRLWKAVCTDQANPIFLWQALIQPKTKEGIRSIAGGTSGSMKNISKAGFLGIRVPKAPLPLQRAFAQFVSQAESQKQALKQAQAKLQLQYDALMQDYFG